MNFLAPWFLLGALAVALPVVFHLIRRTTRERTRFSSLLFLRPVPPRLTRRNRLEHWLLLALRCLALTLLALGFARPFLRQLFPETTTAGPTHQTVILLDTSASLRRGDLWPRAVARATDILARTTPADQLALLTFDHQPTTRLGFEEWNRTPAGDRAALARTRLQELSPGWGSTHLDTALITAAELLSETGDAPPGTIRQILLISDGQEGSRVAGLQSVEWPRGLTVAADWLKPPATSNAGLQWLPSASPTAPASPDLRFRVSNTPDARREQFQLGWVGPTTDAWLTPPLEVYVPPGQSRVVSIPLPNGTTNAPAPRLRLTGDDEPFDNVVSVLPPEPVTLPVLYLGQEAPDDPRAPRYFLDRALQDTPGWTVRLLAPAPGTVTPEAARTAVFAIVTRPLSDTDAPALRDLLARGRTVLWVPPNAPAAAAASLLVPGPWQATDRQPASYALLGEVDFRHPLFAPFADARFSDFTKIRFWRHRAFNLSEFPEARILARFDSGDPALFETPAGPGRLITLASGWHPADSQLALSSKFVPLLLGLLEGSAGTLASPGQHVVGDPVPLSPLPDGASGTRTVTGPDGVRLALPPGTTNLSALRTPGVYTVTGGAGPARFVVNLAPAESRTTPLPADELERLGVPVPGVAPPPGRVAARQTQLQNTELEGRQQLWRGLLVATLAVLLLETWLAGRTARREARRQEEVA